MKGLRGIPALLLVLIGLALFCAVSVDGLMCRKCPARERSWTRNCFKYGRDKDCPSDPRTEWDCLIQTFKDNKPASFRDCCHEGSLVNTTIADDDSPKTWSTIALVSTCLIPAVLGKFLNKVEGRGRSRSTAHLLRRLLLVIGCLLIVSTYIPVAVAEKGTASTRDYSSRGRGATRCYSDIDDMKCVDADGKGVFGREKNCDPDEQAGCFIQTFKDKRTVAFRDCVPAGTEQGLKFEEGCHDGTAIEGKGDKEGIYCFCRTELCNKEPGGPGAGHSHSSKNRPQSSTIVVVSASASAFGILITFLGIRLH